MPHHAQTGHGVGHLSIRRIAFCFIGQRQCFSSAGGQTAGKDAAISRQILQGRPDIQKEEAVGKTHYVIYSAALEGSRSVVQEQGLAGGGAAGAAYVDDGLAGEGGLGPVGVDKAQTEAEGGGREVAVQVGYGRRLGGERSWYCGGGGREDDRPGLETAGDGGGKDRRCGDCECGVGHAEEEQEHCSGQVWLMHECNQI